MANLYEQSESAWHVTAYEISLNCAFYHRPSPRSLEAIPAAIGTLEGDNRPNHDFFSIVCGRHRSGAARTEMGRGR